MSGLIAAARGFESIAVLGENLVAEAHGASPGCRASIGKDDSMVSYDGKSVGNI
jgi:hypothetical protein